MASRHRAARRSRKGSIHLALTTRFRQAMVRQYPPRWPQPPPRDLEGDHHAGFRIRGLSNPTSGPALVPTWGSKKIRIPFQFSAAACTLADISLELGPIGGSPPPRPSIARRPRRLDRGECLIVRRNLPPGECIQGANALSVAVLAGSGDFEQPRSKQQLNARTQLPGSLDAEFSCPGSGQADVAVVVSIELGADGDKHALRIVRQLDVGWAFDHLQRKVGVPVSKRRLATPCRPVPSATSRCHRRYRQRRVGRSCASHWDASRATNKHKASRHVLLVILTMQPAAFCGRVG